MPFSFEKLEIPGLVLATPRVFADERGFFLETHAQNAFAGAGIPEQFVQDNQSHSLRGVIRGLHYQKNPAAQGKLVRCLSGEILDVAVDLRAGSPFFGKWAARVLDGKKHQMLYVPPGFAHGFSVLSETADVLYKVTTPYSPAHERGVRWNDPAIAIDWRVQNPVVIKKDAELPPLSSCDNNFAL